MTNWALRTVAVSWTVTLALSLGATWHGFALGDATPRGDDQRVWRDANGWVIRRLDANGVLVLITRDLQGRIVEMKQVEGRHTPKTSAGRIEGDYVWRHMFAYDEEGRLSGEVDCTDVGHGFEPKGRARLDERRGTSLAGHVHLPERKKAK